MTAVKFTFDDDFQNNAGGSLSQRKQEEMRAEAFAAGRTETLASIEQSCAALLQNIAAATDRLANRQQEQITLMNKESAKLAFCIIEKLAPATAAKTPMAEIELLVEKCLKNSPMEPRLVIRVNDSLLPLLQERIETMQQESEYPGQIVLIADEMSHISDCRVEWANGGVERDFNKLMETIENTVQLFIDAPESVIETHENRQGSEINPQIGIISETITS